MIKGKDWLQDEISKLHVEKSFSNRLHNEGLYPVIGKYNASEIDALVAQLGEPLLIEGSEQQELI